MPSKERKARREDRHNRILADGSQDRFVYDRDGSYMEKQHVRITNIITRPKGILEAELRKRHPENNDITKLVDYRTYRLENILHTCIENQRI